MSRNSDKFNNLQVFLHSPREKRVKSDYEFLMVTPLGFFKVKLQNLNVEDYYIILELLDCTTNQVFNVKVDIKNNNQRILFLNWQDIKKMVVDEMQAEINPHDLLDFDY